MIHTERMTLVVLEARHWKPLRRLLSDAAVMGQLARNPTVESAEISLERHVRYRADHGLGFWVAEVDGQVAGFCGLKPGALDTPIAGELEIGWIFDVPYWGQGLASEAAQAALRWAWDSRAEGQVVAITSADHAGSQRVMRKIGMWPLPDRAFEHPHYAPDDPMRQTVVYAVDRPA